jgi:hypothetical protein
MTKAPHPAPPLPPLSASPTAPEPEFETDAEEAEEIAEETADTHARLRAFEDKHLGENHTRPFGKIERGHGSKFSGLHPDLKAHHAALEALIAAENEHRTASAAADVAHAKLEAAIKRAEETEPEEPEGEAGEPAEEELPDPQAFAGTPHEQALARAKAQGA